MNRLAGWYLWDTEEMVELVSWIRDFNEGRERDDQVRIFGVDITAPAVGVEGVLGFLRSAGVEFETNKLDLGLDLQEGDFWPTTWQRYSTLSDERKAALTEHYDALINTVEQQRHLLTTRSSKGEYERNRWLAEVGRLGHQMFSTADRSRGGAIREHGMAQTLLWILENEMKGHRAILWAHNLHVATDVFRMPALVEGELDPMGVELARELGGSYLAIGGSFGFGSYPCDLPPGERSFEVMAETTVDGALAAVTSPIFLVDLREAAQNTAATTWLEEEREWRAQDSNVVLVPGEAFDLVYFVREISRSQPTPMALERFQELQQQR
jgi:erythromycin esterase